MSHPATTTAAPADNSAHSIPSTPRTLRSAAAPYVMGFVLTLATLLFQLSLGLENIEGLFVLPIILTAWLGGLGSGLFTTAVAALAVHAFIHEHAHRWTLVAALEEPDWLMLIIVGALVSVLCEAMRRARRRSDIEATAARRALDEHLKMQEKLARVVATAPGIIYSFRLRPDGSACVPFASEGIRAIFGIEPSELEKDAGPIFSMMPSEDAARVQASIAASASTMTPFREEFRARRADGTVVWVDAHAIPAVEPDGTLLWQGYINDITDRCRSEEALRASNDRFRQLTESIREVFWMCSPDGSVIQYVSPAFESIWGRSRESLYASPMSWVESIHESDRDYVMSEVIPKQATGYEAEYRIVRPDGTIRWMRDRGFPVRNEHGELISIAGVAEDVTDRRDLESQLRQAQKLESIGLLAGGVAHDFNNWLTVICANGELLKRTLTPMHEGLPLVGEILEAGDRAAALTRQLLALSRQQVLEPRVADMNTMVADAEKLLRRLIGEDVTLVTECRQVSPVLVDPGHMGQVIMNLAVNARDAMPTGGTLTLATSELVADAGSAQVMSGLRPGRYVQLTVADTGIGMNAETRARIFDPFFTTKGLGHGTGLGLAVVHGIVVQSGGRIDVRSEPGRGTTFTILLPAIDMAAVTEDEVRAVTPRGSETILLVEDEATVRRVASRALADAGFTVIEACDGVDALRVLHARPDPIDLVITDVVMPNMGGRELVDALADAIPVLYTSGYLDDAVVRHGVFHAEVAFLQKPYNAHALVAKAREVIDRSGRPVATRGEDLAGIA